MQPGDIEEYSDEGTYIHGLTMEGARWDQDLGMVMDSKLKELRCLLPVIKVIPVTADKYDTNGYYMCPVYMNMQRANVYSAQVSKYPRWLSRGSPGEVDARVCGAAHAGRARVRETACFVT